MDKKVPELLARLKMQLERDVPGNATEAAASKRSSNDDILATPETTPSDNCEARSSSHSTDPLNRKASEASAYKVVAVKTRFTGEHEVIANKEPEPKALSESDGVDNVTQLREVVQEKGPTQEDDWFEALKRSEARLMLELNSALAAFLDQHPGYRMAHDDVYSFVYYQGPNVEDACGCTSFLRDGVSSMSLSAHSNYSRRQHAEAIDGGPRRTRYSSSSSSAYESAVDGDDEEQEMRRLPDGWSHAPSPRCLSRAVQKVQERCDAEAQTEGWDPAWFPALPSTLRKRDAAEIVELKERLETFESHVNEVQESRVKIDKLLQPTQSPIPLSAAELKNCTSKKEQAPTGTNGAGAQVSSRPPQPPLRQTCPSPRPRPEKPRSLPIHPRPRPLPPDYKEV